MPVRLCISQSRRLRLITLTKTLIFSEITKTESNNCFIIHCLKANNDKRIIVPNTVYFRHAIFFAVRELDIALGNHAFRAQPTNYSLICRYRLVNNCRLRCFLELTVGFQPMRRQMVSTMYNKTDKTRRARI